MKEDTPPQLKTSPVAAIPKKIRNFRAILDLSFKLILNGFEMPSVNEVTKYTAKKKSIEQMGNVLPRTITSIEEEPKDDGTFYFIKIDIKYGFCRMIYQAGADWNFAYQ